MTISIETGSTTKFFNSSAPVGWTKITSHHDCALRVVSGSAGTGGTRPFSTVYTSQSLSGEVVVGTASLAGTASSAQTHQHQYTFVGGSSAGNVPALFPGTSYAVRGPNAGSYVSGSAGSGGVHGHPISPAGTISVPGNLSLNVKYIDAILAQRN